MILLSLEVDALLSFRETEAQTLVETTRVVGHLVVDLVVVETPNPPAKSAVVMDTQQPSATIATMPVSWELFHLETPTTLLMIRKIHLPSFLLQRLLTIQTGMLTAVRRTT